MQSSFLNFTVDGQEPYLDSVVLHSPMDTLQDTITVWKTLEEYTPHKVRNLGISNTTLPVVEALYSQMSVKPSVVQNRFHDRTEFETKLRAFCREKGIIFQSFWTLSANPALLRSPPVGKVAQGAGVGAAPAYYALVLGLDGLTVLDGTTNEQHMQEDLLGIEKVGMWAEGEGKLEWGAALADFESLLGGK